MLGSRVTGVQHGWLTVFGFLPPLDKSIVIGVVQHLLGRDGSRLSWK